ncbi:MAG: MFS transporter [Planctomycetaceae bacterium]
MSARDRLRTIAIDLTPLRVSRDYRRVWYGLIATTIGSQFTLVAVFVQLTRMTGSEVVVGVSGLVWLVGLVIGTLAFGPVIDVWDRRLLLALAQVGLMIGSGLLLAGAIAGHPPLWVVYLALLVAATFSALDSPTRAAMTPRLVGAELIPSAQALNQVVWNAAGLFGPAIAGLVIGWFGLRVAYAVDVCSLALMLAAALALPSIAPEGHGENATGWGAIVEGFRFVKESRLIQSTFVIDLIAMIFGMPRALFTFLIVDQFHRSEALVGLLFSAPAVGALLGALTSGWTRRVRARGRAIVWAVAVWGASIALFGLSGLHLWLGMAALAAAGWADVISAIFRSTILQLAVPDRLRGRLSAIHILVVTGGPRLGDLEAGVVARVVSPTFSVVSGGVACVIGAWATAVAYPELMAYRPAEDLSA